MSAFHDSLPTSSNGFAATVTHRRNPRRSFRAAATVHIFSGSLRMRCSSRGRSSGSEHLRTRATRISKNQTFTIETDGGEAIAASTVVVALGNLRSTNPLLPGSPDPAAGWSPDAVKGLSRSATVLLIGSGLTAVDVSCRCANSAIADASTSSPAAGCCPRCTRPTPHERRGMVTRSWTCR